MAESESENQKYMKYFAMIGTSMVAMYGVMYLNTLTGHHVRFSETRFYMTLLMGATMAVVMLGFMWGMYENVKKKAVIVASSVLLFAGSLWLVRSQTTVGDESFMRAMIPHHSIAILTSERSQIEDVRVQKLATEIRDAQVREIKEMDWLLEDIRANGKAKTEAEANTRPVPKFTAEGSTRAAD